jgi:glycosyltransferase involved in cell wall biosynthesis
MRVSVVIPTYNSGPLVVEAVGSTLAQTAPPHEVIVVDDGSTDDTAERLARFGDGIRYIPKPNGGVSSARNLGVTEATGDAVAFLDADDVWHPRKLELQTRVLAARPELGLLGTRVYDWPAASHPELSLVADPTPVTLDELVQRNSLVTSTVLARTDVLRAAGPFDTTLQGPEDYDLWLRVARRTAVGVLPVPLTGYRVGTPNSLSKNAVRMETGLRRILGKLEADGVFRGRPGLRRRAWAYFRYNCGLMYRDAGHRLAAVHRFARSLAAWPLGMADGEGRAVDRPRMLAATVAQLFGRRVKGRNLEPGVADRCPACST